MSFETTNDMFLALLRPRQWGPVRLPFPFADAYKAALKESRSGTESESLERALGIAEQVVVSMEDQVKNSTRYEGGPGGYFQSSGPHHVMLMFAAEARSAHDRAIKTFGTEYVSLYDRFSSKFPPEMPAPVDNPARFNSVL